MVIEWLKFEIAPDLIDQYIEVDEEVWTTTLRQYPGFLGKQVWLDPNHLNIAILIIYWSDREAWKSVPADVLEATEKEFVRRLGSKDCRLIETKEFNIRNIWSDELPLPFKQ
ncbi:MAG: TIGR03792 family protein [Leptolyngbyaceae cyanobacterium]